MSGLTAGKDCGFGGLVRAVAILSLASVLVAGCDTQNVLPISPLNPGGGGTPQPNPTPTSPPPATQTNPFKSGDYIFALKSDPIEGFTFLNTGASMEHWTLRPPINQGRSFCGGAALNGRIYAIGGNPDATTQLASVEMLDLPGSGVWSQVAPLSAPRTGIAAAAANGRIYAIGGFRTGVPVVGTNEEYDPATNTWALKAPNATPRSYAAAVSLNNKIYLMGGQAVINNVFTDIATVEEYDPVTNAWTPKASMPVAMSTHAAAVVNGKIHVVIGSTHLEYDPVANTWTPRKAMTTSRDRLSAFEWNGHLFAVGGRELSAGLPISGAVEEYLPEFDAWTPRMSLTGVNLRKDCGFASIGPSLYQFGGLNATNVNIMLSMEYFAFTNVFPFVKN